jgi:hypothetical protein
MPDEMSEDRQIEFESIKTLHKKIDDLRMILQIVVVLIILISIVQAIQIVTGPSSLLQSWSFYIIIVDALFILVLICLLQFGDTPQSAGSKRTSVTSAET